MKKPLIHAAPAATTAVQLRRRAEARRVGCGNDGRLNQELKRRTRVVRVFPNDASLLRLVTALLVEQSDQWETEKTYLTMKAINL